MQFWHTAPDFSGHLHFRHVFCLDTNRPMPVFCEVTTFFTFMWSPWNSPFSVLSASTPSKMRSMGPRSWWFRYHSVSMDRLWSST